jgi:hypothetical protein
MTETSERFNGMHADDAKPIGLNSFDTNSFGKLTQLNPIKERVS